ncbi:copper chaperone CopZ [Bacillus sp. REN10]|uniref:copper chaperone CopZ n=1 Tax=Bacillus sp. REN10 TaxID=2782541 RepID=UPI00193C283A|nr:copper chaperone CopZ [Bacillus sp. REN10]
MKKMTLQVKGMTCGHCEKAVKTALLEVEGVKDVAVDLPTGAVAVEFDDEKVTAAQMKEAVEDQGYDVE